MTFRLEKVSLYYLLIIFLTVSAAVGQNFPERPSPPKLVNDFADILSDKEEANLEQKLVSFDRTSSSQIAIVTIKSTEDYPISSYAFELGEKWGVGQEGKDNGIVVLVALNDRNVFIATGYGLEGAVPDALAKRIIEKTIKPQFRQENYYGGLNEASDFLIKLTKGEYTADQVNKMYGSKKPSFVKFLPFLFFLLIIVISFLSRYSRYRNYRRSNIGTDSLTFWAWLMLMSSQRGRHGGNWNDFNSGGGLFGGGGGGGFGGFGGGGFGGGGAGGSW